jgi:hypothetical protein
MRICKNRMGIAFLAVFLLLLNSVVFAADGAVTRRFGIFIGSNNGGRDRITLRYAVSDARSVSRVFNGMGGISAEDNILLIEPTVTEINRQLDNLGRISAQARRNAQRTELVFYYSGHSDEDGIMLNRERYGYRELRERINTVQADMRIVILDSCSSGAITRAKGGVKTQPFLFDSSVSAEGYAFLTSSSADEASQESDAIESSYFTHSLLAGLRGAADSVGDGRVTLNELYRYAYTETLAKTETSMYGAQHPSYDIQISGSGDVVLTDIKEISASLFISEDVTGRISIRDSSDFLVAELTKVTNKPLELGLEPGLYRIILQQGDKFYRAEITLPANARRRLGMETFSGVASSSGDRRRGDESEEGDRWDRWFGSEEVDGDFPVCHFSFQVIPGFYISGDGAEKATNRFLLGLFIARGYNLAGIGAASIGLIVPGYVRGIQASGVFNIVGGQVRGIQAAGVFNIVGGQVEGIQTANVFNITGGQVRGIQAAGVFNLAGGIANGLQISSVLNKSGELKGTQIGTVNINGGGTGLMIGVVNVSGSDKVVPIGLVNIIKGGIMHPYVYFDDMMFSNIGLRSGSKHFYGTVGVGAGGSVFSGSGDKLLITRGGFGFEYPVNKLFFDIELLFGNIVKIDNIWDDENDSITNMTQLRLVAGYKLFSHLGMFAGVSFDYLRKRKDTSPDPGDFGGPFPGMGNDLNIGKIGFFGGIQF